MLENILDFKNHTFASVAFIISLSTMVCMFIYLIFAKNRKYKFVFDISLIVSFLLMHVLQATLVNFLYLFVFVLFYEKSMLSIEILEINDKLENLEIEDKLEK